jgi:hypothetical protein
LKKAEEIQQTQQHQFLEQTPTPSAPSRDSVREETTQSHPNFEWDEFEKKISTKGSFTPPPSEKSSTPTPPTKNDQLTVSHENITSIPKTPPMKRFNPGLSTSATSIYEVHPSINWKELGDTALLFPKDDIEVISEKKRTRTEEPVMILP